MPAATKDLATTVRAALASIADPTRSTGMKAYMKSEMPYLGVSAVPLRKAIGWAVREYAKTDAGEVRRYVAGNNSQLSGLSRREALKNVGAGA